jgi:DNA-binding transcriptional LysR family regulator
MDQHHPLDWSLYRSFLAAMQQGSLSGAARTLGMTQPSIGRHIDALEASLGSALFTRGTDGLTPTPLAHELLVPAQAMASAAAHARRVASGLASEPRGTVRITASQMMGGEVLPALLARYRETHPQVTIELVLSNQSQDLLKREADIAVRMVKPTQQSLIARRLGKAHIGLYAHQQYVKRHGLPQALSQMRHHALIGTDQDPTSLQLARQMDASITRENFCFRCDNDLAQLAAMRAGLGIAGCHVAIARRDPALVRVLPEQLNFSLEMWLLTHVSLRSNQRVMGLFRFLTEALTDYARQCV